MGGRLISLPPPPHPPPPPPPMFQFHPLLLWYFKKIKKSIRPEGDSALTFHIEQWRLSVLLYLANHPLLPPPPRFCIWLNMRGTPCFPMWPNSRGTVFDLNTFRCPAVLLIDHPPDFLATDLTYSKVQNMAIAMGQNSSLSLACIWVATPFLHHAMLDAPS